MIEKVQNERLNCYEQEYWVPCTCWDNRSPAFIGPGFPGSVGTDGQLGLFPLWVNGNDPDVAYPCRSDWACIFWIPAVYSGPLETPIISRSGLPPLRKECAGRLAVLSLLWYLLEISDLTAGGLEDPE